LAYHYIGQL